MEIRKYLDQDYLHMSRWFINRGLKPPTPAILPRHGVIITDIAAGFLITTDCRFGILDYFITNPDKEALVRLEALDSIAQTLTHTAKNLDLIQLFCNTTFSNIKSLATRHGFKYLGEYASFAKEI